VHIDPNSVQLLYMPWGTLHTLDLPPLETQP
jgi:hypothetical protein